MRVAPRSGLFRQAARVTVDLVGLVIGDV